MTSEHLELGLTDEEIVAAFREVIKAVRIRDATYPTAEQMNRAIADAAKAKAAWNLEEMLETYEGLTSEQEAGFDLAIGVIQDILEAAGIPKPKGEL